MTIVAATPHPALRKNNDGVISADGEKSKNNVFSHFPSCHFSLIKILFLTLKKTTSTPYFLHNIMKQTNVFIIF